MSDRDRADLWELVLERPGGITATDVDDFARAVEEQRRFLERTHAVLVEAVWETPPEPAPGQTWMGVRFRAKER